MATSIQLDGKPGPSILTTTVGSTYIDCYGCYYNEGDSKYYSSDAGSNTIFIKSATDFRLKFYTGIAEGLELPATPSTETILDSTDFTVKVAGVNLLQASSAGGGNGGTSAPFPSGSEASPSINFASDTNTGFYRVGAGIFGLSLGGAQNLRLAADSLNMTNDNDGTTNFGQYRIQGLTNSNKYLTLGLDTTNNFGFIEAGLNGTGYYDLVLNKNGANCLIGTDTNSYSTNLFISGSLGANSGLILKQGSLGSLALNFTSATTTGFYYSASAISAVVGGAEIASIDNTGITSNQPVRLMSDNSNYVELKAPGSLSASYYIRFPSADSTTASTFQTTGTGPTGWVDPFAYLFGNGVNGPLTISSGTTSLASSACYTDVTISGTGLISTAASKLFISGTLTFNNTTSTSGVILITMNAGGNGAATTAGTAAAATSSGAFQTGNAGSSGAAGTATAGGQAAAPTVVTPSLSGNGGNGGAGGAGSGGAGGASRAGGTATRMKHFDISTTPTRAGNVFCAGGAGGAGGSGGGGNGTTVGAGGGAGGHGGRILMVYARIIQFVGSPVAPLFASDGGVAGNGGTTATANCGGGGGGGGGSGGAVLVVCSQIIGTPPNNWIRAKGSDGGAGGNGNGTGIGGNGGTGGAAGYIYYVCLMRQTTFSYSATSLGTAGGAASGITGGTAGPGATATIGTFY